MDGNVSSRIVEPSVGQQDEQRQQTPAAPVRSKIVQRLLEAKDLQSFLKDLLTTQAVQVAGTEAAAFLIERQGDQIGLRPIEHIRPDESSQEVRLAALRAFQNLVQPCVQQSKDGAIEVGSPDGGESQYCLVTILAAEGQAIAVSAVITRCKDMDRARQRLTGMQLVAGYFEVFGLRKGAEQARMMAERHQNVLQFTGAVANAEGFDSAAMGLCNELATRTGASRVSLGWLKGRQIKVKALSHTEKFDKKQELIVELQKVMEECYDQEEPVQFDPDGESSQNVTRSAAQLSRNYAGGAVLSAPLRRRDDITGVITLEFPPKHRIDEQVEGAVAVAIDLLAPQLYDRYENDRYIWVKIGHSIRDLSKHALGPKHMGIKILILSFIALILTVCIWSPTYRVRAPFQLVAQERRAICAPFEGKLKQVFFKPGVPVKQGQVMATMDTFELKIRLADAKAEVQAQEAEIRKNLPDETKGGEVNIAIARKEKALVDVQLLEYQISQAEIKAPFDCMILKGDLYERQGAPVKQGDPLFEIALADPQNPNRFAVEAELQIPDRDVQEVKRIRDLVAAGKIKREFDGELATTTDPNKEYQFDVIRIVPQGSPREAENVFSVFASIKNPDENMVPGLTGEARVNIEKRPLIWWWTHRLVDWLKLKFWI